MLTSRSAPQKDNDGRGYLAILGHTAMVRVQSTGNKASTPIPNSRRIYRLGKHILAPAIVPNRARNNRLS